MEMEFPAEVGVENEFEAFGNALSASAETGTSDEVLKRCGPRATVRDLALIEAAIKSSEEKREISLRELVGEEYWTLD